MLKTLNEIILIRHVTQTNHLSSLLEFVTIVLSSNTKFKVSMIFLV